MGTLFPVTEVALPFSNSTVRTFTKPFGTFATFTTPST